MTAFIGMGGNLDDPRENLLKAMRLIERNFQILQKSLLYRTRAVGGPENQPDCFNAVIEIAVNGSPQKTLAALHAAEKSMGRVREIKWGPRIIDLDLLDQDGMILDVDALKIPHPMMHKRIFVLAPLAEIKPDWIHPELRLSAREMLDKLPAEDKSVIIEAERWPL